MNKFKISLAAVLLSVTCAAAQPYRVVNGHIYDLKATPGFVAIDATVDRVYTNAIQMNWRKTRGIYATESYGGVSTGNFMSGGVRSIKTGEEMVFQKEIILLNYSGTGAADGQHLTFQAMQIGTTNVNGSTLELWDCGEATSTPPPEEVAAAKAKADALAAQREAARLKTLLVKSNTVVKLQAMAASGEPWAQCSLGEHYLNGDGCETNREIAIKWLNAAAKNGNLEASNKLATLAP